MDGLTGEQAVRTSAALTHVRQGSRAASPVVPAPPERAQMAGIALAPPPLMQPVRTGLLRRRKTADGGSPPRPPKGKTGMTGQGKPQCDRCLTAQAAYEITIDSELLLRLVLCVRHYTEHAPAFRRLRYAVRKL